MRGKRLPHGRLRLAVLVAATFGVASPALPNGAAGHDPGQRDYIGLWGYFTTCRAANELMFAYGRRRAMFPHETVAFQGSSCRILSRRGAFPRWELEMSCRVWTGAEPPPVIRVRQVITMRDNGRTLDIDSFNRTTGETRTFDVFYCRQEHEPELLPLGILDPPD